MNAPAGRITSAKPEKPLSWPEMALLVGWVLLAFYWMATYSGPYLWLSEWQMRHFGAFMQYVSVGVPAIVGWGASMLVLRPVLRNAAPSAALQTAGERFRALLRTPAVPVLVFAAGVALAVHVRNEAASYGPLRAVTPAFLGADPGSSRYLEITGRPDPRSVTWKEGGSERTFFGVRETGAEDRALVPVFVSVDPRNLARHVQRNLDGTVTVRGLVRHGMDVEVKHYLAQQGVSLAPDPWVLDPGQSPAEQAGQVPWIVGLSAVGAVVVWLRFRRL